jgi:polyphenol oxidase
MPFHQANQLRYFSFSHLRAASLHQGIFTRQGGASPAPWDSLNTGGLNGDERVNVVENRRRIFAEFGLAVETIFDVWQVHSSDVVVANAPRPLDEPHQKADAILTNCQGVSLFMRFGDCVPVFFFDPRQNVIGLAHAGWPGTVGKIVQKTVSAMEAQYQCRPGDILAGIGPSICAHHYEVKEDVYLQVQECMGAEAERVLLYKDGKTFLDLWETNQIQLLQAGLRREHIEISGICTAENPSDWFSHRGEHGKTGRFGALLALK